MKENCSLSKRKLQKLRTREKIIETSVDLFTKKGFYNVTVNDICKHAGISKGAFYHHFPSKVQIIVDNFIEIDHYYQHEVLPILSSKSSAVEKLLTFNEMAMRYISKKIGINMIRVAWHSLLGPGTNPDMIITQTRPLYQILNNIVREGQLTGEIRSDLLNSKDITNAIIRCIRGVIYDWCLHEGCFDLEEESKKMTLLLLNRIQGDGVVGTQ